MALLDTAFDSTGIDTSSNFDTLPAGDYQVRIIESDRVVTQSGQGQYLKLTMEIMAGQFAGRRLWDNLNLWNHNEKAVQIAQKSLAQICQAVGVARVTDTQELHNIPMVARVTVKQDEKYGAQNKISVYMPAAGAASVPKSFPPAAPAPKANGATPPWKR